MFVRRKLSIRCFGTALLRNTNYVCLRREGWVSTLLRKHSLCVREEGEECPVLSYLLRKHKLYVCERKELDIRFLVGYIPDTCCSRVMYVLGET